MKTQVYLVGAGPGDPDLLSIKGQKCISKADVVIYDYLASPSLLKYAPERAEKIYVGKKGGDHTLSQDKINLLIVEKAKKGLTVTRLKGGDPFIFGRGGEEAEILSEENISFEIVPGITSAIAAPAYAGIPLTHRSITSTVAFVTGHEDPLKKDSAIDWNVISKGMGTIVFLMGIKNLPKIVKRLRKHGMNPGTSVSLIRWGTTNRQQTLTGTLETIAPMSLKAGFKPPAVIVVGEVVRLRDQLKWFENRPLMGKKIIVTRSREQASALVDRLNDLGAECVEMPTIKIELPDDFKPLDDAIANISIYNWIIFTSVNGVEYFFKRLFKMGKDVRSLCNIHTAAIGPATSEKLKEYGFTTDIIPESYRAESVVKAFSEIDISNTEMLLPRAAKARTILPEELTKMGAKVTEIAVYNTKQDHSRASQVISQLETKEIDMVTFTSSSTVKNYKKILIDNDAAHLLNQATVACIGPITSDTAIKLGFNVKIVSEVYTIPGLCNAILDYYDTQ